MPLQQHVDVPSSRVFPAHFVKRSLDFLRCYDLSFLRLLLKLVQDLPLLFGKTSKYKSDPVHIFRLNAYADPDPFEILRG